MKRKKKSYVVIGDSKEEGWYLKSNLTAFTLEKKGTEVQGDKGELCGFFQRLASVIFISKWVNMSF